LTAFLSDREWADIAVISGTTTVDYRSAGRWRRRARFNCTTPEASANPAVSPWMSCCAAVRTSVARQVQPLTIASRYSPA
jgi:hypothetical protein